MNSRIVTRMNSRHAAAALIGAASLLLVTTGAAQAATFDYSTTFTPTVSILGVIPTNKLGDFVIISNSSGSGSPPTTITLTQFTEVAGNLFDPTAHVNDAFTLAIDITPVAPPASGQTQDTTGDLTGTFNITKSNLSASFNTTSLVYNFGPAGTYTLSNFQFVTPQPDIVNGKPAGAPGSITADVNYVAAAPEPTTVASFGLGGFGLLGLMLRARNARRTVA